MIGAPAREALAALDQALAARPLLDEERLSLAVRQLCAVRDALAARPAEDGLRVRWLGHVNGIITMVLAGHFPLGDVRWDDLARTRGWLADLVAEV